MRKRGLCIARCPSVRPSGNKQTGTGVSCRQPAADIRVRRLSSSSLCRHDYAAAAADSSGNSWRPRLSGGSNAGVEQSASTDQGRLVAVVFSAHLFRLSYNWVDWKWRTWKWRTIKIAGHEIAGHEFAGHKNAMHEIAGHENARHEIGGQTTEK